MKKRIYLFLAVLFIFSVLVGCSSSSGTVAPENPSKEVNTVAPVEKGNLYKINAELNAADKTLTVSQSVKYVNTEDVELKELYFHVYANAFKTQQTAPFLFDDFERAYSRGFQPGFTEITSVKTKDGNSLKFSLQGEGSTIMRVEFLKS